MKSRRRIALSKAQDHAKFGSQYRQLDQEITTAETGISSNCAATIPSHLCLQRVICVIGERGRWSINVRIAPNTDRKFNAVVPVVMGQKPP